MFTATQKPASSLPRELSPALLDRHSNFASDAKRDLRAILSEGVALATTEAELAVLVRLGVERCFGGAGRWAVFVGRGVCLFESRRRTSAIARVACLRREYAFGAKTPPELTLTIIISQPDCDAVPTSAAASAPPLELGTLAPHTAGPSAGAGAGAGAGAKPADDANPILVRAPLPADASLISYGLRTHAASVVAASIVGGALATIGLHANVDTKFLSAVRAALRAEWGSTWHVFLCERGGVLAPSSMRAGAWFEFDLPPVIARATGDAGKDDGSLVLPADVLRKTPKRLHLYAFSTAPGHGEPLTDLGSRAVERVRSFNVTTALRALCYACGLGAFLASLSFSSASDNSCSRMRNATTALARMAYESVTARGALDSVSAGVRTGFAALRVFSSDPAVAAAALIPAGLGAFPIADEFSAADHSLSAPPACSRDAVLAADVRIMRSRFLLGLTAILIVVAAGLLRPLEKMLKSASTKAARDAMRRADAKGLAGMLRSAPRDDARPDRSGNKKSR
jgi:hypothetical protein